MSSSKFATPFFQKSPLYGAYTSGADGMVTVSDAEHFAKLQGDAAGIIDKAYSKDKCDDPNVVQYTENSVLKKCPKKTSTSTSTSTTSSNSIGTMPADLNALANKGKNTKTNTSTSFPSTYDFLAGLAKPIQDKAVNDIKNAVNPNNNQIIK
tara:strand:+ start:582 stop:1037 length:456 start_codon:yes stop_codon:yes gene_type:complete